MSNFKKARKYHFIYKTTNLVNGMYYIGMHSTNKLDDGYVGSGKRLWYSIRKYGIENFKCEILEFLPDRDSLAKRERVLVNEETLLDTKCLNLKRGGHGGICNEEHRKKLHAGASKFSKERWKDTEYRKFISNMRSRTVNEARRNGAYKNVNYATFTGRVHKIETREKMSFASKGKGIGKLNSQYGTCWITKDGVNKKIKKENLDSFIRDGWVVGRCKI